MGTYRRRPPSRATRIAYSRRSWLPWTLLTSIACADAGGDDEDQGDVDSGSTTIATPTAGDTDSIGDCAGRVEPTLVYSGRTHQITSVPTTCRAESMHSFVYVDDSLWNVTVDDANVANFIIGLEQRTLEGSIDPEAGILVNNEAVFGPFPTLPGGDKLGIFIVDTEGAGDGYLCDWCDYPQIHLDLALLGSLASENAFSIAAHESYHVIHDGFDRDEATWVDESLAESAMTVNGYFTDDEWLADYLVRPDINWGPGGVGMGELHYGAALLWGTFLWERGGAPLLAAITREPANDWEGIDAALAATGIGMSAWELYVEMLVALALDAPELGYGFASFDVGDVRREGTLAAGVLQTGTLQPYGVDIYEIGIDGPVEVVITTEGAITAVTATTDDTTVAVAQVGSAPIEVPTEGRGYVILTAREDLAYEVLIN